ncbi:MAG: tetratricopeptide repeat protein [Spirochaetales bacterium]|nr:tetratricopeptide repeat protein [Spirochaetales bacterium]
MKINILVMDTSTSFTSPWKKELGDIFGITEVIGGFEAIAKLKSDVYSIILVNISINHLNGVDAIRKIRDKYQYIPIIVLYDPKDVLNLKQTMIYGIQQAIPLPVNSEAIEKSISNFVRIPNESSGDKKPSSHQHQVQEKKEDFVDVEAHFYEGLSAIAANQIERAIEIYKSLLDLTNIKKERWLKYIEESMFHLGQCYARLKDFKQSNKYYSDFISKAPYHNCVKEALLYLGKNYEAMKDFPKAIYFYKKVINMRPFDSFSTQARKFLKSIVKN